MSICIQQGCGHPSTARKLCSLHYKRFRKGADLGAPMLLRGSLKDRFWSRVDKSGSCWLWAAGLTAQGYGQIRFKGRSYLAHRLSYEWHNEEIPPGMQVDHACRNRSCVNPSHLRLATDGLNKQNRGGATIRSKSGVRGVSWNKDRNKWVSRAQVDRRVTQLGYFDSLDDAEEAVVAWRREHMPYSLMDKERKAS